MRGSVNIHLLIDTTVPKRELVRGTGAISGDWGSVTEMYSVLLMTLQHLMDEHRERTSVLSCFRYALVASCQYRVLVKLNVILTYLLHGAESF